MNIIFIVSDTFRKDNLTAYADRGVQTPHLDRFAENCVVFNRAYANSFPTMPARADFFTGKHTFTYRGWEPLSQSETTLAEIISSKGVNSMCVTDTPFFHRDGFHYEKGFDDFIYTRGNYDTMPDGIDVRRYRTLETDWPSPRTMFEAERWLQRHYKEEVFLYADTWDPHEPWDAPNWYTELYDPEFDGSTPYSAYGKYKDRNMTEEDVRKGYAAYCGQVTMVDRWIGRLLDTVKVLGLMDNSIIIFTSDHGYYFGEHGHYGKSVMSGPPFQGTIPLPKETPMSFQRSPLYQEVANIPLLIYTPKIKPRKTNALVSHVDIMPTLLDLLNIDVPSFVQGRSLVPILEGKNDKGKECVFTSWPLYNVGEYTRAVDHYERKIAESLPATITTNDWQMIYSSEGEIAELYDLNNDPKQENDVFSKFPEKGKELHEFYREFLSKVGTEDRLLKPRLKL
jgi:arylsulfatase A-like enzyme